jgi:hypothetical protein
VTVLIISAGCSSGHAHKLTAAGRSATTAGNTSPSSTTTATTSTTPSSRFTVTSTSTDGTVRSNPGRPTTTIGSNQSQATAPPPAQPQTVVVTNADDGKNYALRRGDRLVVQLQPDGYTWTEPASSNSGVLGRDGGGTKSDGSANATFTAAAAGSADASAEGRSIPPPCATATPRCATPDHVLEFKASVTVVG